MRKLLILLLPVLMLLSCSGARDLISYTPGIGIVIELGGRDSLYISGKASYIEFRSDRDKLDSTTQQGHWWIRRIEKDSLFLIEFIPKDTVILIN